MAVHLWRPSKEATFRQLLPIVRVEGVERRRHCFIRHRAPAAAGDGPVTARGDRVILLVGTRKGLFVFESDARRRAWRHHGPYHKGWGIQHAVLDPRRPGHVYACAANAWWGSHLFLGRDFGRVWQMAEDPKLPRQVGKLKAWWHVAPGPESEPNVVYAGVEPAALFRSADAGRTWKTVNGLNLHGSRRQWQPGGGGLILHTIHPDVDGRMIAAVSAAGVFVSDDRGSSWHPVNDGIVSEFLPDPRSEVGACPHKVHPSPGAPKRWWQQNHCGVYRSDDGGRRWRNATRALPSGFGFPLAVHPRDPDTAWVAPLDSADFRAFIDGQVAVWRTCDAGKSWDKLTKGLPGGVAFTMSYREGLAADALDPVGVYFGTASGAVFASADEGDSWSLVAEHLPPVLSVSVGLA